MNPAMATSSIFSDLSLASRSNIVPVEVDTCSHLWTIHNFSYCCTEIKKVLKSSCFSATTNRQVQYYISLYLPGLSTKSQDKDSLAIFLHTTNSVEVSAKFTISILNSSYEKTYLTRTYSVIKLDESGWGHADFTTKSAMLKEPEVFLPGDKLTIFCELRALNTSNRQTEEVELAIPSCQLLKNFGTLYQDQSLSDVTLSVAGKEFRAHKAILAARSPVFQAMFTHVMEENMRNRVNITDIDDQVMNEILRFIYTGEASDLEQIAADLLIAADKYALDRLKVICEKELCSKFSIENVVELVILADRYSALQLKAKAINFIKIHAAKVMDAPEWKVVIQHPHLIEEILRALVHSS